MATAASVATSRALIPLSPLSSQSRSLFPSRLSFHLSTKPSSTPIRAAAPTPTPAKKRRQSNRWRNRRSTQDPPQDVFQREGPLGRKELGKDVVRWIEEGMRAMATDLAGAEERGEFTEDVERRAGLGSAAASSTGALEFVIHAQPHLNAVPMPQGREAVCLKMCAHYPTLLDHFQRELTRALQELQEKGVVANWRDTRSWKQLRYLKSAQRRSVAQKRLQMKPVSSISEMNTEKAKIIQQRIDDLVKNLSDLLRMERDAELEFTEEELNAIPTPNKNSGSSKPIEFLVSHESQQEQCDTICNLKAIGSSIGLGGMHLILFKVEGDHRLPPTNFSPGDMVRVRTYNNNKGAGATSSMQGFIDNLGEDGCSITVALESHHGDPTFSKLFGKSIRIDRIQGLADTLTYERNCEALVLLQKNGLHKNNASIAVVATLFGDEEDRIWLEKNGLVDWGKVKLDGLIEDKEYDESQMEAIALGLNKKRPLLTVQGPPGSGKTGLLKGLITLAVAQGEQVLVTATTNAAVDNMVDRLSSTNLSIVRVGNPARISATVASKSLGEIVKKKLNTFKKESQRKKAHLKRDLRHLEDDSLAAGIRQLLKQLAKVVRKKEKETIKEVLSNAQVILSTNTGAADPLIRKLGTFDLVVIDEAGQATEPSCWIPILQGKRCILAGDQCQLAPVILSRKAMEGGLGISLLERAALMHEGRLATKLKTQYRMHDAIASWASKEMYHGDLTSSQSVATHLLADSPFVKKNWITQCPLLLLDTRMPYGSLYVGCEEHLDPSGTGSLYNEGEADIVVQHIFSLIYSGVPPNAIAVQSPYIAQVQLLRDKLDVLPEVNGVEVATIDSFQGREADAVVISMVRSNALGAVGFLGDSRRTNVAITRARKHVAVVCDSSTICNNSFLARLLRHIRQHGKVKHASEPGFGGSGLDVNSPIPLLG